MILENLNRVVFAGDSITDMQRAYPIGEGLNDRAGFGYVRMIDNLLAAWYPEICVRVTNAGISGNTSRDLRARYDPTCQGAMQGRDCLHTVLYGAEPDRSDAQPDGYICTALPPDYKG